LHPCIHNSSATAFVTSLKERFSERAHWVEHMKYLKLKYRYVDYEQFKTVVPVVFDTEQSRNLLAKTKIILETYDAIAINPREPTEGSGAKESKGIE
jgi:hypothetical protein